MRVRGREHAHVRGSEIGRNMRNGRTQSWRTREQLEDGRITAAAPCTLRVYHLLFGCPQSSASMMGGGTMNSRALLRNDFALRGAAFIRPVRPSPTNMPRERASERASVLSFVSRLLPAILPSLFRSPSNKPRASHKSTRLYCSTSSHVSGLRK